MSTLPEHKIADASGIYNLMRNIGGAVGLALINSRIDWLTAWHSNELNSGLTPDNWIFVEKMAQLKAQYAELGDLSEQLATQVIYQQVHYQALASSFNDLLKLLAMIMLVMAFLTFFMDRGKKVSL